MTKVKICGLTDPAHAVECVAAGAWAIGVVLALESPRYVTIEQAVHVLAAVPDGVARVGVFVDAPIAELARAAGHIGLTHLQLHGAADIDEARRVTGLPIIRGVQYRGPESVNVTPGGIPDLVLFDAAVPGVHGGTGVRLDWDDLAQHRPEYPFGLAGGLRPDNVYAAIRSVRPEFVDVSSGVELSPGLKDHAKVKAFMAAVQDA